MTERSFNKGEIIFKEGELGDTLYRVADGSVAIVAALGQDGQKTLTELGKDSYFGEMAVVDVYPRSASAVAAIDGTVVNEYKDSELKELFASHPEAIYEILIHLSERLRNVTTNYLTVAKLISKLDLDSEESRKGFFARIKEHREASRKAVAISEPSVDYIRKSTKGSMPAIQQYDKGTIICKEGEKGKCMYSVQGGNVGIFTGYGTPDEKMLTEIASGSFFGEMGMLQNMERSATAVAVAEATTIEAIYPEDLEVLFKENPTEVIMIVDHLASRLRNMTKRYNEAYKIAHDLIDLDDKPASADLKDTVKGFKANIYA